MLSAEGSLLPRAPIRVQASKLLKASANFSIIVFYGVSVETGGRNPNRVKHFAEAGAATEQLQSGLRVGNISKCFENPKSLGGSGMRVAVAVLWSSHRSSQ